MKPKKSDYQTFDEFVGTDEAEKIVDRVMGECKKEGWSSRGG